MAVTASDGMTALHRAVAAGDLRMIDLLLRRGAPLEAKNSYGGTVLAQAIWHAFHDVEDESRDHAAVIDRLIAAGARTDAYPEMPAHLREVRRRSAGSA